MSALSTAWILLGAVAGIVATGAMTLMEMVTWRRLGLTGVSDWHQNQVVAARILRRPTEDLLVPGLLIHFFHGALAGIFFSFALSAYPLNIPVPILGAIFGLALWLVSLITYQAITGVRPWNHPLGGAPLFAGIASHILYGVVLGLLL